LDQMQARLGGHGAGLLESLSRGLEKLTNPSGSHLRFGPVMRAWHAADYWTREKAEGCTPAGLKDTAGVSRQALMFHSISEPQRPDEDSYYIRAGRFHRLMHWLQCAGYKSAGVDAWLRNEAPPDHVLLTF